MNLVQMIQHQPPHHLHLQGYNLADLAIPQAENAQVVDRQLSSRKIGRSRITTTRASERITTAISRNTSNTATRSSTSSTSQGNTSNISNNVKLVGNSNYYVPSLAMIGRKELHYCRMTASSHQGRKNMNQLGGNLVQSASKPILPSSTAGVKHITQSQKIHPTNKNNNSAAKNGKQQQNGDIQQSILAEVNCSCQSRAVFMDGAQTSDRFYDSHHNTELSNHANSLGLCRFYDLKRMLKIDDFENAQQQGGDQVALEQMMMLGIDEKDRRIHLQDFKQKVMAFLRILHLDKHNVSRKKLQKCFKTIDIASKKCDSNNKNHSKNEQRNDLDHTSKIKLSNQQQDVVSRQQQQEVPLSSSRSRSSNNRSDINSNDPKDSSVDLLLSSLCSSGWRSKRYYQINQHQFEELPLNELYNLSTEESQRYNAILTHLREIGRTFTVNVPNDIDDAIKKCHSNNRTKTAATCLFTETSSTTGWKSVERSENRNAKSPKNKGDEYDFILEPKIHLENTTEIGHTYNAVGEGSHNSSFESSNSNTSPVHNRSLRLVLPRNMKIRGQAFNDFYEYIDIKPEMRQEEQIGDICSQTTSSIGDNSGIDIQEGVLKTEPEEMDQLEEAVENEGEVDEQKEEEQDGIEETKESIDKVEEQLVIALSIPVIEEQEQQNEEQEETESNSSDNRIRSRSSSKGKGQNGNKGGIFVDKVIERQDTVVVPSSESIGWSKSYNNNKNMYPSSNHNSRPASNYQQRQKKISSPGSSNSKPASASSENSNMNNNNNSESQKKQQYPKGMSSYSKDKDGNESDGFEEAPQEEVKEIKLQAKDSNIAGNRNQNQFLSNQTSLQLKIPVNSLKSDEIATDKEITSNSAIRQKSQTTNRNNGQSKDKNNSGSSGNSSITGGNRRRGETVEGNDSGQKRQQQQQKQNKSQQNDSTRQQQALQQMSMKDRIQTEIRIEEEEEKQRQQLEQNRLEYVQLGSGLIDRILQETAKAQQITNNSNTNDFNILDFDLGAYFVTQTQQQQSNQQASAASLSSPPNINTHHVIHQTQADKMLFTKMSRWQLETEEDFYEYQEQLLSTVLAIHGKVRTVVTGENQEGDLSLDKMNNSKSNRKYEKSKSSAAGLSQNKQGSKQSKSKNRSGKESEMIIKNGFTMDLSNGTEIEIAQIGAENPSQNFFTDMSISPPPSQILNISRQQSSNPSVFNQTPSLSRQASSFKAQDQMNKRQKNNSKDTVIRKDSRCSEIDDNQDDDQEEEEEKEKVNNSSDSGSRSSHSHSRDSMGGGR